MTLIKSKTAKIAAGLVGFALVAAFAVTPVTAGAQTSAELQAMINTLLAQIAALQGQVGGSTSTSHTFTMDLTVGSSGAEVTALQQFLVSKGFLTMPAGVAMGTFGPLTQSAVAAYQTSKGISPASGYFGPITRAAANAGAVVVPPPANNNNNNNNNNTTLEGTDGTIADVNLLSQYNNEEVGDGQSEVKVLGFEVEASTDGDIEIRSVKVSFDPAGNAAADSDHLDDYIDGITVWMGSEEVGSADVDAFTENSDDTFTKTITLDSGVVVESDTTEKFYVTVDAVGNLDSGDIDSDSWTVGLDSIRYEDGSGVVTTEATQGDLPISGVTISFVDFSTSADTELKISSLSDSPDAGIIVVDDSDNTDDVVLLKGKFKVEGDSAVVIDELPVTLTSTGDSVPLITGSVRLTIGGEEYTESVATSTLTGFTAAQGGADTGVSGTITFDNLDFTIDAGDTVEFTIFADINDTDTGGFDAGGTLLASITGSNGNRESIDVENEEGDQLATGEKTGSALGEAQEFRTNGVMLDLVSKSSTNNASDGATNDLGQFSISFDVTAIGDDIYLATIVSAPALTYSVDKGGTATTSVTITSALANDDDTDRSSNGNWLIEEGETEQLTLTVSVPIGAASGAGLYRMALTGLYWDTDDDTTPDNLYSSNLDELVTAYVSLN